MQKIYFEKWIDLNHQLKELLSLSVDESINYKIESVGVRAVGSLIVKGEYNDNKKFDENIELDVLATFDKIVDQRDFNIKVEDFDYFIKEGNVQIKIEVGIHGVVEGEDRYVRDEHPSHDDTLDEIESLIKEVEEPPVEQLTRAKVPIEEEPVVAKTIDYEDKPVAKEESMIKEEPVVKEVVVPMTPKVYASAVNDSESVVHVAKDAMIDEVDDKDVAVAKQISEQLQEKVYQSKSRPIFQDTSDSIGTYYLYIVKENDSYSDVATRYSVDEDVIRNYNQDKALEAGSVLIIPYVP